MLAPKRDTRQNHLQRFSQDQGFLDPKTYRAPRMGPRTVHASLATPAPPAPTPALAAGSGVWDSGREGSRTVPRTFFSLQAGGALEGTLGSGGVRRSLWVVGPGQLGVSPPRV